MAVSTIGTSGIADANITTAKLADATVTTAKLAASSALVGKNLVQNGAMTVAQRGSVNAGAGSGGSAYTQCDRWYYHERGGTEGAAVTLTQDTDVPAGQGFAYSLKCDVTTAEAAVSAGEMQGLQTRIEAHNLQHLIYGNANAKTVVLSFWFKSPKSGAHCVGLYQPDGTRSYIREFTVASADTWEQHTVTFPGDASGTITNDNGEGLRLNFALTGGSTYQVAADGWAAGEDYATSNQQNLLDNTANNIYLTGVQLEVGSVATDFEHEDIGTMLAKCKRYYEQMDFDSSSAELVALCNIWDATAGAGLIEYQVEKRALPTVTITAVGTFNVVEGDGTTQAPGSITGIRMGTRSTSISVGLTAAALGGGELRRDATDVCNIKISAEL
jgi:hypothetical protein